MDSTVDKIKVFASVLLVIGGVVGYYLLPNVAAAYRVLVVLAGVGAAAGVALTSVPGKAFKQFASESIAETKRVVWPTRRETIQATLTVVVFAMIMAVFLWVVDAGLAWGLKALMGWGA